MLTVPNTIPEYKFARVTNGYCTWQILDCHKSVSNCNPSISCSRTSVHHLGDIDTVIPRYVLVPNSTGDGKAQTFGTLEQLYLS